MSDFNQFRQQFTYDGELPLSDEGTVTAGNTPVVGQVGGSDQILTLGTGRINGHLIVDVSAIVISGADELYRFELLGSNDPTMATDFVALELLEIGHNSVLTGDVDLVANRYVTPFSNILGTAVYEFFQIRLAPSQAGGSITWFAWINKNPF